MLLVKHGAPIDATDDVGRDAFHYAALANRGCTIVLLRKLFPRYEPACDDTNGNTPLHLAVQARAMLAVKALLVASRVIECGLSTPNALGLTPVQLAVARDYAPFFHAMESILSPAQLRAALVSRKES